MIRPNQCRNLQGQQSGRCPTSQDHRIDQRPFAPLDPERIKRPHDRVRVPNRGHDIAVVLEPLAGDRVHRSCRHRGIGSRQPTPLAGPLQPQHEIPRLRRTRLRPFHLHRPQKPPPTQQRKRIAANRRGRTSLRYQVTQESSDRLDRPIRLVHHTERLDTSQRDNPTPLRQIDQINHTITIIGHPHAVLSLGTA